MRWTPAALLASLLLNACSNAGTEPSGPPMGAIRVVSLTTGSPRDPDGYTLRVGWGGIRALGVNDVAVDSLPPGTYQVGISGNAANCPIRGANPREIVVKAGRVVLTTFEIVCGPPTILHVSIISRGDDIDATGYDLSVDQSEPVRVPATGDWSFSPVLPGTHSVRLADLAPNCEVAGPNPQSTLLSEGAAGQVEFVVDCPRLLPGTLEVSLRVSLLINSSPRFYVLIDDGPAIQLVVGGSVSIAPIAGGRHVVRLLKPSGCSFSFFFKPPPGDPGTVSTFVPSGGVANVAFTVLCIG